MLDLSSFTPQLVTLLAALTVAGQVIAVLLLALLLLRLFRKDGMMEKWILRYGMTFMFIVALTATVGSLFFSEIAGWTPCKLCWIQRIFMYPQALLLGLALYRRDRGIVPYILLLSIVGLYFSGAHYAEQVQAALQPAGDPLQPCDAGGVSCANTNIRFTFGYITIPLMAFTAFAMNALMSVLHFPLPRPSRTGQA